MQETGGGADGNTHDHPIQVMLEEDDAGLIAALDIESSDDPRAIVRFQSPRPSRLISEGDGQA